MTKKDNQQSTQENQRYIPMIVTTETIRDFGIERSKIKIMKIGCELFRTILVPATEDVYLEYMRPLWREQKRIQRHANDISMDWLYEETEFEFADSTTDIENFLVKQEIRNVLREKLAELDEIDRQIMLLFANGMSESAIGQAVGLSQRGVGKRKKKLFEKLREQMKDYC